MSGLSSLMFISLWILCVFSFNYHGLEMNDMCEVKSGLLCMKDELIIIGTIAKGIARKLIEMEKHIQQTKIFETLNKHVSLEMNYTRFNSPVSFYHNNFSRRNNIDKEYLNGLFFEAHNAMIYYYNSINYLLNLEVILAHQTDEWFTKIKNNIKDDIICRYRSFLDVYSKKWKSIHDIGRIQFSKKHRLAPSFIHDVHSMVIARYLREWMKQINEVIVNLEMKFV